MVDIFIGFLLMGNGQADSTRRANFCNLPKRMGQCMRRGAEGVSMV